MNFLIRLTTTSTNWLRDTSAPKGLRNTAQGQPSLSEATLGQQHTTGKQTQYLAAPQAHQQRLQ